MEFFRDVREYSVRESLVAHVWLSLLPVLIAFVVSLPIGWAVSRYPRLRWPVFTLSSVVYTIPSLAVFFLLPAILGTSILDPVNVVVALSMYSVALLVRTTADALDSVDPTVVQAATAMGFKPARRWFSVELPMALPVVLAGLRVATVTNVSLVTVSALLGISSLGQLFTRGFQLGFYAPPIVIGLVLTVALAFAADALIVLVQRRVTPWTRAGASR